MHSLDCSLKLVGVIDGKFHSLGFRDDSLAAADRGACRARYGIAIQNFGGKSGIKVVGLGDLPSSNNFFFASFGQRQVVDAQAEELSQFEMNQIGVNVEDSTVLSSEQALRI